MSVQIRIEARLLAAASRRAAAQVLLTAGVVLVACAPAAKAQLVAGPRLGSAAEGAHVFGQCRPCHSLEAGINGRGPTLHGLFGRRAGSVPGFRYLPGLSHTTIIWDDDSLSEFLSDPKRFLRGRKIAPHPHIADPTELGDLLAYLESAAQ